MLCVSPICDHRCKGKKEKIAARNKSVGKPVTLHRYLDLTGERGLAHPAENGQIDQMIVTQFSVPIRKVLPERISYLWSNLQLHRVALTIVKADCLDPIKP